MLSNIIVRVDIEAEAVRITINRKVLADHLGLTDPHRGEATTISVSVKVERSGKALRMVLPGGQRPMPKIDETLVNGISIAHRWWADLLADPTLTLEDLASREGVNSSLMTRTLRLAFLDPMIVEQICVGKAPAKLSFETLRHPESMPALWAHQRAVHSIAIDG